jgi:hypothetical protein
MGQYDDFIAKANALPTPAKGQSNLGTVAKSLSSVNTALINSPAVVSSGKYADFINKANNLAAGEPSGQGGVLGTIAGGGLSALSKVGQVLGTPARIIASTVKEVADLATGEGFSPDDWQKQIRDKNFYMSRIIPKSGNKWIDGVLGLAVDIGTDPLTWIGLGGASRASRVAMATEAATLPIFANAPEKINAIARLGALADLSTAERAALGEAGKLGLRAQFGKKGLLVAEDSLLGKGSAKVAGTVGRGLGNTRAAIGDVLMTSKVRDLVTPKSYRILGDLGRAKATVAGGELIGRAAAHSAGLRKQAEAEFFRSIESGTYRELIGEIDASPFKNTLYQVADGTRVATDPVEQALADRWKQMQAEIFPRMNAYTAEVNARRGTSIPIIQEIDDYGVNHSVTNEAGAILNSSVAGKSKWSTELAELTGLTKQELEQGKSIVRVRKLVAGKKFLGTELKTGSIDEINGLFKAEFGVDLFKTDASSLVRDYIAGASDQVGRVAFVDRLMDYGPDIVDKVIPKIVADAESVKYISKTVRALEVARNAISRGIDKLDRAGLKISDGTLSRAEKALATGTVNGVSLRAEKRILVQAVKGAETALAEAEALAVTKTGEVLRLFLNRYALGSLI